MERTSDGEGTGGGGIPPLELRVARVEDKVDVLTVTLKAMELKLNSVADNVAEIKGRLSQSPTWIQLLVAIIATWGAGAAIVPTLLRFPIR